MSPSEDAIEKTPEPLICSYPGSAIEMPNEVFDDGEFQFELAKFLSHPGVVSSDLPLPPPSHPRYIHGLFNGISRGIGHAANIPGVTQHTTLLTSVLHTAGRTAEASRIIKRVRGHVGRAWGSVGKVKDVWRRSPLWLLIRVAIQMTVNRSLGLAFYKQFILFFLCTLAMDENSATLSNDLLQLMTSKIVRRLSKLDSSPSYWLTEMIMKTRFCLVGILQGRRDQLRACISLFQNPSQDELIRDTKLSLLHSGKFIQKVLANSAHKSVITPFHPTPHRRGTIEDFLSLNRTFFDEAYNSDPDVTLYDVERSVEQGIDDWVACVTDVDEACAQLEILMDKYMMKTYERRLANPEDASIRILTGIELYVALDKLAVKEIPMLADYPPEIPMAFLERMFLRKATSLHRLSCAYQYLSMRHSQSRSGWSILSNKFTEDSFPVRYYDQSPYLQQLKARIEHDAMNIVGQAGSQVEGASLAHTYHHQEYQEHTPGRQLAEPAQSPLPAFPLHAKVVVFELQCPACIRIWRSAAPRILQDFYRYIFESHLLDADEGRYPFVEAHHLLACDPALQPYFVERQTPLRVRIHFAYSNPEQKFQSQNEPTLRYIVQHPDPDSLKNRFSIWQPRRHYNDAQLSFNFRYWLSLHHECLSCKDLAKYVDCISHTSNYVMSTQANCPADLSINEFIAFAHLRSGGSLQWLNILQGLRSRTLNLHRHQVHYLLAHAAFQVGPLDLNSGAWIWHQELQDPCFCNALLDELHSLLVDVGAGSIDGMLMNTISLLLTRVLASSPSEGVSDRAIMLLQSVRKKTFGWVQQLSHDLAMAPMNEERRNLLLDMASTCRSTFNVDPDTLCKLFNSPEDVDALLSCAFFIHALRHKCMFNSES